MIGRGLHLDETDPIVRLFEVCAECGVFELRGGHELEHILSATPRLEGLGG